MKFCTQCGKQLSDAAVFCPGCGYAIQTGNDTPQTGYSVPAETSVIHAEPPVIHAETPVIQSGTPAIQSAPPVQYVTVDESVNPALVVLAALWPLFGFIYWIICTNIRPRCARACGIASIVSWLISFMLGLIIAVPLLMSY